MLEGPVTIQALDRLAENLALFPAFLGIGEKQRHECAQDNPVRHFSAVLPVVSFVPVHRAILTPALGESIA